VRYSGVTESPAQIKRTHAKNCSVEIAHCKTFSGCSTQYSAEAVERVTTLELERVQRRVAE